MCGIHFNTLDVTVSTTSQHLALASSYPMTQLHADAIYCGSGQLIPMCRGVCHTVCLLATPGLQELAYLGMSRLFRIFNGY